MNIDLFPLDTPAGLNPLQSRCEEELDGFGAKSRRDGTTKQAFDATSPESGFLEQFPPGVRAGIGMIFPRNIPHQTRRQFDHPGLQWDPKLLDQHQLPLGCNSDNDHGRPGMNPLGIFPGPPPDQTEETAGSQDFGRLVALHGNGDSR